MHFNQGGSRRVGQRCLTEPTDDKNEPSFSYHGVLFFPFSSKFSQFFVVMI